MPGLSPAHLLTQVVTPANPGSAPRWAQHAGAEPKGRSDKDRQMQEPTAALRPAISDFSPGQFLGGVPEGLHLLRWVMGPK